MKLSNTVTRRGISLIGISALLALSYAGCASNVKSPAFEPLTNTTSPSSDDISPVFVDRHGDPSPLFIETIHMDVLVRGTNVQITNEFTIKNPLCASPSSDLYVMLPENAVVNGFAYEIDNMDVPHQMIDAAVVPSRKLYRQDQENHTTPRRAKTFHADLRTILPFGKRRARIQYTMPLNINPDGTASLFLPMLKSTKLLERNVRVSIEIPGIEKPIQQGFEQETFKRVQNTWVLENNEKHATPQNNLLISLPQLPDVVTSVEHYQKDPNETFFEINLQTGDSAVTPTPRDLSKLRLIWDASGSRTTEAIRQARSVLELLPESGHFELHVLRNTLESPVVFDSRDSLIQYVDRLDYDGGTNFAPLHALAAAGFDGMTLFFTDGVDTFLNNMPAFGERSAAIISGNVYDIYAMNRVCAGNAYALNSLSPQEILKQLEVPQPRVSVVKGAHISDVEGIGEPDNGRITVSGKLNADSDTVLIRLTDDREYSIPVTTKQASSGSAIATSWASSRVRKLATFPYRNRNDLVELGKKYTIVTPYTQMTVPEDLSEFTDYNIEPPKNISNLHTSWLENRDKTLADWSEDLNNKWDQRVRWHDHPIPHNLNNYVNCSDDTLKNCVKIVGSDLAEHTRKPVTPPKGWQCTEENLCNVWHNNTYEVYPRFFPSTTIDINGKSVALDNDFEFDILEDENSLDNWKPDRPWLKPLAEVTGKGGDSAALYAEYMRLRDLYKTIPGFYQDVSEYFFEQKYDQYALRILSNLTEIMNNDDQLWSIYAKQLLYAGMLDEAIDMSLNLMKQNPSETVFYHNLAIAYEKRGKRDLNAKDIEKALLYYYKTAFSPQTLLDKQYLKRLDVYDAKRRDEMNDALIAIEEFNVLASWTRHQKWSEGAPEMPQIDNRFHRKIDSDYRVTIQIDSKVIDQHLHVTEPSSEDVTSRWHHERRSATGSILSDEINDYGTEEYLIRTAHNGKYTIHTGEFTCINHDLPYSSTIYATIYKNWGLFNQSERSIVYHPDEALFCKENTTDDEEIDSAITTPEGTEEKLNIIEIFEGI